ncbi:SLC13 family permease [Cellulomonas fengjieae]|uniref:Anion permease n=1 Tax=Cellulomonas fengjieae TaxID=2819978 RepID=A0ABS3SK93_9CELL|nr:SLC13 family permease [Cellulomonas fengjieae]MBO3086087.1 anion permease [Cellulomonas fengjieae]QVI65848.1 anion permease [Cellulomonas fengjieae]
MSDAVLSLLVLAGCVGLFVWNRLSVGVVAILTALALYATGLIDANQAIAGFGDPVVVFIATLFVVSEGLESSGVTAWAGQELITRAGTARTKLLIALMALSAVLAALVTPNGATAALLPVVVLAARRSKQSTSQMLMPLAFAASAGALLVLSGSTVNVIVSDALFDSTGDRFGFFEFGLIGLPLVLATIAVSVLVGRRLLPDRSPTSLPADYSEHVDTLVEHYSLDVGFFRLGVRPSSDVVGRRRDEVEVPEGVVLIGVQREDGRPAGVDDALDVGDVVVVTGDSSGIASLVERHGLVVATTPLTRRTREALLGREVGVAELVVRPRSRAIGEVVFAGMARSGVTVLGVRRLGKDRGGDQLVLAEGDSLLVHGPWPAVEAFAADDDVLIVDSPELVRRQTVALGPKAWRALAVLAVTVLLLATGVVPPAIAGLVGAALMVMTGVVGVPQAYRAVSWQIVVLIGGLIPLSVAISSSGAADLVAGWLVDLVGDGGPRVVLATLFLLTLVLGQVVSNTATVLIIAPIAVALADASGVALAPVLMLVAVAGAASFLTPIATPANMMVMGPGGYAFSDYWKLGLATTAAWFAVAVLLIPVIWPT